MLPGEAPGRGAPGLAAPGRGAGGRGMGRSTGCADENGLLPTRGVRTPGFGIGPGRGPGVMPGCGAGWPVGCPGVGPPGCPGGGADGRRGAGVGGAGASVVAAGDAGAAAVAVAPVSAVAAGALVASPLPVALPIALSRALSSGLPGPFAGALAGTGLLPPKDSRSRRATGASTVDDADLTNSPCSFSRARTSLLVTPSSFANSCTRALPATTSPVYEATAVGRASGLAMTHCHRGFTVCSCSLLPVLLPWGSDAPSDSRCSTTADVSGEPAMRNAFVKARRRIACCAHCGTGCSHAPRPGRLLAVSTITAYSPFPLGTATTRSSSTANSRFRHPTHVRTGPSMLRCAEAEVSRWITAQLTFTQPVVRTNRGTAPATNVKPASRRPTNA